MQIVVLCVLSERPPWLEEIREAYSKKLRHFVNFEIRDLKPKKHGRDQAAFKRQVESELLLGAMNDQDHIVLLDEKGKDYDSIEFSKRLSGWQNSGKKRIIFVIGGAYGVSEEVKSRAQESIRLSRLTYNHLLAQAVLLEQIYRAFAILKGIPYHNE